MDWTYKAMLTAVTVGAVLMSARLMGRRVAGLLAGLPVITIPALLWVAQEQGIDFAVHSAMGSAAACAMAPLFAAGFLLLAQRFGAAICMAGAALVAWVAVTLLQGLAAQPGLHLAATAASCMLVRWLLDRPGLPVPGAETVRGAGRCRLPMPPMVAGKLWATAVLAGVVSATVSLLAAKVGPYWSGVLSTLPLISACGLVHLQRSGGPSALPGFVSGYLAGVFAKALFVCCFAWTAPHFGMAPALALALVAGAAGAVAPSLRRDGKSCAATRPQASAAQP